MRNVPVHVCCLGALLSYTGGCCKPLFLHQSPVRAPMIHAPSDVEGHQTRWHLDEDELKLIHQKSLEVRTFEFNLFKRDGQLIRGDQKFKCHGPNMELQLAADKFTDSSVLVRYDALFSETEDDWSTIQFQGMEPAIYVTFPERIVRVLDGPKVTFKRIYTGPGGAEEWGYPSIGNRAAFGASGCGLNSWGIPFDDTVAQWQTNQMSKPLLVGQDYVEQLIMTAYFFRGYVGFVAHIKGLTVLIDKGPKGACCLPTSPPRCLFNEPSDCRKAGGTFKGNGILCDSDADSVDDACP